MAALGAWAIEYGAVGMFRENFALQNATVLQRQVKNIALCRVGHRIETHDGMWSVEQLQAVSNASESAVPPV